MSISSANASRTDAVAARRLRTTMAAVRLSFTWFGVRRSLSAEQKEQAADSFGAEGAYLSAAKKLIDTSHHAYKAVTAIRGRERTVLAFAEFAVSRARDSTDSPGRPRHVRCPANHDAGRVGRSGRESQRAFDELKQAARDRLGRLFNRADYPESLIGLFRIEHDYPSVEPPNIFVS